MAFFEFVNSLLFLSDSLLVEWHPVVCLMASASGTPPTGLADTDLSFGTRIRGVVLHLCGLWVCLLVHTMDPAMALSISG